MGMLSFIKEAGEKLFGKGKAQERQGHPHRIQSDPTTSDVAKAALTVQRCTLFACGGKVDEAYRLLVATSPRPS